MRTCRKAPHSQGGAAGRRLTVRPALERARPARPAIVPRGMREGKTVLTIKVQDERARFESGAAAMISDLQKLVVLPLAMILFLCAASTSPGLIWRGSAPAQIVAAR
jgi:hypothetical protein